MKKRLKEMEEEAAALREMQAKVEKEMGAVQGFESNNVKLTFSFAAVLFPCVNSLVFSFVWFIENCEFLEIYQDFGCTSLFFVRFCCIL